MDTDPFWLKGVEGGCPVCFLTLQKLEEKTRPTRPGEESGTLGMEAFCHSPDRCLDDPFWIAIVRINKGAVCFPHWGGLGLRVLPPPLFWDWLKQVSLKMGEVGLPFKMTKYSQRYKDTSTALDENNEVKHLITHSLGSSVGAQITKDYPERELTLTTYGAPFISRRSKITDDYINFRSILDPVSIADRGAITVYTGSLNPFTNHDYITGYGDQGKDVSRSVDPVTEII